MSVEAPVERLTLSGQDVERQFGEITSRLQGFDEGFTLGPAAVQGEIESEAVPFGRFSENVGSQLDEWKKAMATSTGYTGNNAEESH